ncbi:MAG: hypothetical protein CFE26_28360 [Verrucomicrobiales bacterium VVV1]|nr:MAG: hypothetical protein CFE26_28360 [Verrucomicrobiales bacterium VVV1]
MEGTLQEFAASGLMQSSVSGVKRFYWVRSEDWLFLRSWEEPRGFPRWIDWARLFHGQGRLMAAGGAGEISPLLQASELRRVFEELAPVLEVAELRVQFAASRDDRGLEFGAALLRDFERLYAGF